MQTDVKSTGASLIVCGLMRQVDGNCVQRTCDRDDAGRSDDADGTH